MLLRQITLRSRLGDYKAATDGMAAFFDRADGKTGKTVRHFVLLDEGVKLMYEPWGWQEEDVFPTDPGSPASSSPD